MASFSYIAGISNSNNIIVSNQYAIRYIDTIMNRKNFDLLLMTTLVSTVSI